MLTKDEWINRASLKLQPYIKDAQKYAESLYQTYIGEGGHHWEDDPEGAVDEDMSYWE